MTAGESRRLPGAFGLIVGLDKEVEGACCVAGVGDVDTGHCVDVRKLLVFHFSADEGDDHIARCDDSRAALVDRCGIAPPIGGSIGIVGIYRANVDLQVL